MNAKDTSPRLPALYRLPPIWTRRPFHRYLGSLSSGRIVFFLVPVIVFAAVQHRWLLFASLLTVSTVLIVCWRTVDNLRSPFRRRVAECDQTWLNRRARAFVAALEAGQGPAPYHPVILFLRPFAIDKKIRLRDRKAVDGMDEMPIEHSLGEDCYDWATTITVADQAGQTELWNYADLTTDPALLYYTGFGEIELSDANWFSKFESLAEAADLIISVPLEFDFTARHSATVDELIYLKSHSLLDKCVFLMPPEQQIGLTRRRDADRPSAVSSVIVEKSVSQLWASARAHLAQSRLALPPYCDSEMDMTRCYVPIQGGFAVYVVTRRDLPGFFKEQVFQREEVRTRRAAELAAGINTRFDG